LIFKCFFLISDQNGIIVDQPAEDELTHRAADAATDIHSGTNGTFMAGFPFTVRTLLLILVRFIFQLYLRIF
jgi:hypothetical protein